MGILILLAVLGTVLTLHAPRQSIAIIITNDIHGSALPTTMVRSDTNQTYEYGGLVYMASMIQSLKQDYKGHVLYLDSGDQFQGGIESSALISQGASMTDFFNEVKVDGAAVGNHDLDFGRAFLEKFMQDRKDSLFLSANLESSTKGRDFLPHDKSTKIYTFKSGLKLGIIGLITLQTLDTIAALHKDDYNDFKLLQLAPVVISQSKKLRQQGVHAVLLLSHVGNNCVLVDNTYGIWEKDTPQPQPCPTEDQLGRLINALPEGTIDAIAQGHRHVFAHHYQKGIPLAGAINGGFYFNIMYLEFLNKRLVNTKIEGPIPVCKEVFSNTNTCSYMNATQIKTAGKLVPMVFRNRTVKAHPRLQERYNKWMPKMQPYLEILAFSEILLQPKLYQESDLGDLIADLMSNAFPQVDFPFINVPGFRSTWFPGYIQYQHFFAMFPFNNQMLSFDITGDELLKMFSRIQLSRFGVYATKGLKQTMKIYANGTKEYLNMTLSNGTAIDPKRTYRGLSLSYLLNGGGDFINITNIIYTPRNVKSQGMFRDRIKVQLKKLGRVVAGSLMDPNNPRLRIIRQ